MNVNEVFSQVLNMSLTASVVILFVLAARFLLRKAPKIFSYTLWAVVLFRLLCPVAFTSPVSLLELFHTPVDESQGIISTVTYIHVNVANSTQQGNVNPVPNIQKKVNNPQQEEQTLAEADRRTIAARIWLMGLLMMVTYSLVQYALLRRRLIGSVCLRKNYYLTDHIDTPFVMGIFRPRIYLPSDIPVRERCFIIAHERHHIRRGDNLIKLAAYAALCIHWFNPLVWVAFVLAGKDMEMSCDEAVIQKLGAHIRADYSATLLRLATGRRIIASTPLAFGEGDTKGRVKNMAKWKKPKLWVTVAALVLCLAVLAACAVNPEEDEAISNMEAPAAETTAPAETEATVLRKNITAVTGKTVTTNIEIVTYGELSLVLHEGYSGREEDGSVILSKGTEDIGGITYWNTPEIPLEMPGGIDEWVRALGLPEAQENQDVPIGYMMSNSAYGDVEAVFFNELEPEKLNVFHVFLIAEDIVYDVHYDLNNLSSDEAETFLKTIQLFGEPVAANPSEQDSLAKCRAVLEMVQSASYSIRAEKYNEGTEAVNDCSALIYDRHNEDWLSVTTIPMDAIVDGEQIEHSKHAYMYVDGVNYSNEANGRLDENEDVIWAQSAPVEVRVPWLATFQWNEETVAYIDTLSENGGTCVMLRIDEPYPYGEDNQEFYFVNFYFDAEGSFINVQKQVNLFMDNAYTEYESIVTLDSETVAAEINREYQRAIG